MVVLSQANLSLSPAERNLRQSQLGLPVEAIVELRKVGKYVGSSLMPPEFQPPGMRYLFPGARVSSNHKVTPHVRFRFLCPCSSKFYFLFLQQSSRGTGFLYAALPASRHKCFHASPAPLVLQQTSLNLLRSDATMTCSFRSHLTGLLATAAGTSASSSDCKLIAFDFGALPFPLLFDADGRD